jgi:hypothetical protein
MFEWLASPERDVSVEQMKMPDPASLNKKQ